MTVRVPVPKSCDPSEADTEHLKAFFGKGVLEVHAEKQTVRPKKIEITKE